MADPPRLERAQLIELERDFSNTKSGGKVVNVQINPESLKVSFANQLQPPANGGDRRGSQGLLFVGAGTTKLTLQLWFDVTGELPQDKTGTTDVRDLTKEVVYFITPQDDPNAASSGGGGGAGGGGGGGGGGQSTAPPKVPPGVRFSWGTFRFDGIMESLEESIEFWSSDGKPLRSSLGISLSQQKITNAFNPATAGGQAGQGVPAAPGGGTPGTRPLTAAPAGATVQGLAAGIGAGASWQAIASANGIENPRALAPGQLIDLSARGGVDVGVGIGVSGGIGVSAGAGAAIGGGASIGAGAGIGGGASLGGNL